MKPITDKQIDAIEKLARATRTSVNNLEQLSCFEASKIITVLIEKANKNKKNNGYRNNERKAVNSSYKSDALAGLAVKILAQRCKVEDIVGKAEKFRNRAVELFKVFDLARRECLAA